MYVFPAVSVTLMVLAGRAAVPVTIRKFPSVLLDGKPVDMWELVSDGSGAALPRSSVDHDVGAQVLP